VKAKAAVVITVTLMSNLSTGFSQDVRLNDKEEEKKLTLERLDGERENIEETGSLVSGMGVVRFVDGDSLKCEISYLNTFKIKVNGKLYSPKVVDSFSLYDFINSKKRSFHTLEFDDERSGVKDFYFFEVLFEFNSFAILEKTDPPETFRYDPAHNSPLLKSDGRRPKKVSYDRIYVLDGSGNPEVYLETRHLLPAGLRDDVQSRVIKNDLLLTHLGPHLNDLERYAGENKLSFEQKEDFLKIMQHYKMLVK
jgi:hypothetical protein